MRLLTAGRSAVLVELGDLAEVVALHAALRAGPIPPGVVDLVPAARTVLVRFAPPLEAAAARAWVQAVRPAAGEAGPTTASGGGEVELSVVYDGADLAEVAALTGLPEAEVVRRHAAATYVVAFCGFAPGFAYCSGGDPALRVPRRDTPRTRVPAGSVAVADEFTGVYPREAPGGWRLLGRTDARLWDLDRDPPALLAPGTRVRFGPVAASGSGAEPRR